MRILVLFLGFSIFPFFAHAEGERIAVYSCAYKIVGYDFAQIKLGITASGTIEDYVTVTSQGRSHRESATAVPLAEGEELHFWISQESKDNSLETIIFKVPKRYGKSVMYNPHIPMGKEMWGECTLDPAHP
ncbi:MAG: hypothetical protein ACXWQO_11355 [Bdellovibrionota bacterium]